MRVLHINCNYIGTALHQLMVEKLDEFGYKNSVFVPTYDKNLSVITPNENVLISECFKKWDRLFFDYKQKKIFDSIQRNYSIRDFNVIHAYTLFTDGNCARLLSEKYGVPYVVAVRNTDVNSFFRLMPHLRKRGVKNMLGASAIFFLSEAYKQQVFEKYIPVKYHDVLQRKSYIIPNGIDDFWFHNVPKCIGKIDDKIKLIYAGRIDRNKNILTTQRAMELLRSKGFEVSLTVVGKVADERLFTEIKKDPYTICLSAQPKEKLLELYRNHNIFVMPSFTETFGLVYAEAMSQGLPIVYTKGQGFDGQFVDGLVGYSVNAKSAEEVANAVEKITDKYDEISANAIASHQKFHWDKIVRNYMEIYESL